VAFVSFSFPFACRAAMLSPSVVRHGINMCFTFVCRLPCSAFAL
jgi:hypothetical protein